MTTANTPLRQARINRGLSLMQVAAAVNWDTGNLCRVERGKQACSLEMAERLVEFYGRNVLTELHILYPERYMRKTVRRGG